MLIRNPSATAQLKKLLNNREISIQKIMRLFHDGADPNCVNNDGNSLLHIYATILHLDALQKNIKNHYNNLEMLVYVYNADINKLNRKGLTPLLCMLYTPFHTNDAMKFVSLNAHTHVTDNKGRCLLDILKENNRNLENIEAIIELIKKDISSNKIGSARHIDSTHLIRKMLIGRGSSANIYNGEWNNQKVVIKNMFSQDDDMHIFKFHEEVRFMDELTKAKIPYVIQFFGFTIQDARCSIVMEACPSSLYDRILNPTMQPLAWNMRCSIGLGVITGLDAIHQHGICHNDINSANILLDNAMLPKISDFGLSNKMNEPRDSIRGTLLWCAPETSTSEYSVKSDIYSYGITLLELAAWLDISKLYPKEIKDDYVKLIKYVKSGNRPPIPEKTPSRFHVMITRCWETNPQNRPQAAEIKEHLRLLHENLPAEDNATPTFNRI